VIKGLDEFSFEEFEAGYFESNKHLKKSSFITVFQKYIDQLATEERLGTASSYTTTKNALKKIKPSLKVNEITPAFLKQFEDYHLRKETLIPLLGSICETSGQLLIPLLN